MIFFIIVFIVAVAVPSLPNKNVEPDRNDQKQHRPELGTR
jgi:hypothetical protein